MNRSRIIILVLAAVAAGVTVFLMRGLLGGGSENAQATTAPEQSVAMADVLVASEALQPGVKLSAAQVRWQQWPKSAVDSSFITRDASPNIDQAVNGTVVRAPMVEGEPLASNKIVHADGAGFMAATLTPGMRAVSIGITTETGAGGFILPNDRVDVLLTQQVSENPRRFGTRTMLHDVRVLAVDQTYTQDKDQKVVLAKTATLELTEHQAETVERAQSDGTLSLTLRPLANDAAKDNAMADASRSDGDVSIIRYGLGHGSASTPGGQAQ
ncbi:MAG TPA: Flp pilus assembly protein CpaB [Rhizomicrobium sp.]|jgi:pilus assembly protein CpaB|nr:Flp pilus assembly protein CpaB [Rhizomicrobium sp.]